MIPPEPSRPPSCVSVVVSMLKVRHVVGGEIVEVNDAAVDDPAVLNRDAGGKGWLVKIKVADTTPLSSLLDATTYDERYPAS